MAPSSTSTSHGDAEEAQDSLDAPSDDEDENQSLLSSSSSSSSSTTNPSAIATNSNGSPSLRRSQSSLLGSTSGGNPFAPPFYNRPPTPLPPSPSLTSLLRPPFSRPTSRPTTPDTSDNETPNDTEAAVAKSARTATTVPRASPKVPTYEYYGFVLYLVSGLAFLIYLLWSYLPSPFLHQLGIYYYPNRWWSLAIPSFLVMLIIYIYVALASYNTAYLTLPMNSIENIVDEAANIAALDRRGRVWRSGGGGTAGGAGPTAGRGEDVRMKVGRGSGRSPGRVSAREGRGGERLDWKSLWSEGTDAVMDVPIGGVCEVLYGQGSSSSSSSTSEEDDLDAREQG